MKKSLKISLVTVLVCTIAVAFAVPILADTIFTDNGFSYTQLDGNYASVCDWEGGSDTLNIPLRVNDSYVKEISAWAFSGRDDFSAVQFYQADYLSKIGAMAFKGSAISGSVNLPAQVKTIGSSAFQECTNLETLYYNATADIPDQCFYKCTSLENVIIVGNVSSIGKLAFADCESLSYVLIPKSVTGINASAFNNSPNVVIYCYTDSYAHQYAVSKNIPYVLLDAVVPTEPPTTPATEPPTEPKKYLLGDADTDGYITILDATTIQRVLADYDAKSFDEKAANVTGEGLNIVDATLIQRYLAEIPISYAVGEWFTYDA